MIHRYAIEPRPATLGGGWRLRLLQQEPDGSEVEQGGGIFPLEHGLSADDAYAEALHAGEDWLASFSGSQA